MKENSEQIDTFQKQNESILFLQSEVHNYHISLLKEIIKTYKFSIVVIHWDKNNETPFRPPVIEGVIFKGKNEFKGIKDLKSFINNFNIKLVRTSGWVDKEYLKISKYLKAKGIASVVVSDTQWKNTLRQTLGSLLYGWYIRSCFTKMMVAGPYQFEYARKLGFSKKDILFNNLSADTSIYKKPKVENKNQKTLLFVGRLEKVKGVDLLLEAWSSVTDKKGWKLVLVGQGSFFNSKQMDNVIFRGFISGEEIQGLMESSGFFVLPSRSEPWGVVMHEATLSGLPILCSDEVGAIPLFMIHGYNGFTFKTGDVEDLKQKLERIINLNKEEIILMKHNSLNLGQRITTPISAASLMAAIVK